MDPKGTWMARTPYVYRKLPFVTLARIFPIQVSSAPPRHPDVCEHLVPLAACLHLSSTLCCASRAHLAGLGPSCAAARGGPPLGLRYIPPLLAV